MKNWLYIPEMNNLAIDINALQAIQIYQDTCNKRYYIKTKGDYPASKRSTYEIPSGLEKHIIEKLELCLMRSNKSD